jgi:hypothetical protein
MDAYRDELTAAQQRIESLEGKIERQAEEIERLQGAARARDEHLEKLQEKADPLDPPDPTAGTGEQAAVPGPAPMGVSVVQIAVVVLLAVGSVAAVPGGAEEAPDASVGVQGPVPPAPSTPPVPVVDVGGCFVPERFAEDPYRDRNWRECFWDHPYKVARAMPKSLQPHLAAKDWDLLAVGIPLTIAGGISFIAAVVVAGEETTRDYYCEESGGTDCRKLMNYLAIPLGVGGILALGAGVPLDAIGGNRRFVDPQGEPIPERGEAKAAPKLTVKARIGVGCSGLEGTF